MSKIKKKHIYKIGDRIDITTNIKINAIPKFEDKKTQDLVKGKKISTKKSLEFGEIEVIISNSGLDRYGEKIIMEGIDFSSQKKAPMPVLWGHQYSDLPIGHILKIWRSKGNLMARLALNHKIYEFANLVYKMILNQDINSVSIGGLINKFGEDEDEQEDWAIIAELEMLEVSVVTVGAHPDALITSKDLGVKPNEFKKSYEDFVFNSLVDKVKSMEDNAIGRHIKALKNIVSALESVSRDSQDTEKIHPKKKIKRLVIMRQVARQCDKQSELIISSINNLLQK